MNISINKETLIKWGLSIQEFLLLLFNIKGGDLKECSESLIKKGWADKNLYDETKLIVSNNRKNDVSAILIDSTKTSSNIEFEELANKLKEVYPKGKKPGTTYMWRDSTAVIARKLKTLVVKYNYTFTEEQAINATQRYVTSFNGNYQYMQLLKYFLLKTFKNANGDVEIKSDFMSYIENENQDDETNNDWTSTLK